MISLWYNNEGLLIIYSFTILIFKLKLKIFRFNKILTIFRAIYAIYQVAYNKCREKKTFWNVTRVVIQLKAVNMFIGIKQKLYIKKAMEEELFDWISNNCTCKPIIGNSLKWNPEILIMYES